MGTTKPIYFVKMKGLEKAEEQLQPKVEVESCAEFEVNCKLCNKVFASFVALQNHVRMAHIKAYETGDPTEWTDDSSLSYSNQSSPKKPSQEKPIDHKQISKIVQNLSIDNVSYIIIKTEDPPEKKKRKVKREKEEKPKRVELKKEPEVITGPFECLEQSTVGSDGVCHQMFFSCCEYSEHQLIDHVRPRRRVAKCQVCERPLSYLRQTSDKEFICENLHCGQAFETAAELARHRDELHAAAKKRFECSVCHKKFSAQGGVAQHMRMHTGDRPYHCTVCPKAFTQKSGLEQHLRTHTKVKPFRCVICSKTFVQTVHLKQHMRTHTQLAPFRCPHCGKRFKQASHLNYHARQHPAPPAPANTAPERSNSLDRETALAEQSIKEEGTFDVEACVAEASAYVDAVMDADEDADAVIDADEDADADDAHVEKVVCEVAGYEIEYM